MHAYCQNWLKPPYDLELGLERDKGLQKKTDCQSLFFDLDNKVISVECLVFVPSNNPSRALTG